MRQLHLLLFFILMIQPSGVFAQFDASTANFVGQKNSKAPIESDYSPGRYKVHERPQIREPIGDGRRRDVSGQPDKQSTDSNTKGQENSTVPLKPIKKTAPKESKASSPVQTSNATEPSEAKKAANGELSDKADKAEAVETATEVKDSFFVLSSGVSYVDIKSEAPSYARKLSFKTTAAFFKGEIWLMPQWGVQFEYARNFSGTIEDDPNTGKSVSLSYQTLGLDASWRTPWISQATGHARYVVSAGLFDQNIMPEASAINRVNIRTTGVRLTVARVFQVNEFQSKLYFTLSPYNSQSEDGRSGSYKSGDLDFSSQMTLGLVFGSKINEQWSYFIHPSVSFENTTYKGLATADPVTSKTYENLSVNSTTSLVSFGLSWGQ